MEMAYVSEPRILGSISSQGLKAAHRDLSLLPLIQSPPAAAGVTRKRGQESKRPTEDSGQQEAEVSLQSNSPRHHQAISPTHS